MASLKSRGSLAAAAAAVVLAAIAPATASAKVIGKASAAGDYAIALASGSADHPTRIYVKVTAKPKQRVSVFWNMVCSKGFGAGSKDGDFSGRTTLRRKLKMPMKRPDDCTVSASAQLDGGSGRIKVVLQAY